MLADRVESGELKLDGIVIETREPTTFTCALQPVSMTERPSEAAQSAA
jgi:hypothetical protein